MAFRQQCNRFRAKEREDNKLIYPKGHQLHGRSVFDDLTIGMKDNSVVFRPIPHLFPEAEALFPSVQAPGMANTHGELSAPFTDLDFEIEQSPEVVKP